MKRKLDVDEFVPRSPIWVLTEDALRRILAEVAAHVASLRAVCRLWYAVTAAAVPRFVACDAATLAADGHSGLLGWMAASRGAPPSLAVSNRVLVAGARAGHIQIVELAKQWGATFLNCAAEAAVKEGHTLTLRRLEEFGANDVDRMLAAAAKTGRADLVRYFRNRGAVNATLFFRACCKAAKRGHQEVVTLGWEWEDFNRNDAMVNAASGGHEGLVRLCRAGGADDFDAAMEAAAAGGHESLALRLRDWGGTPNALLAGAARAGNERLAAVAKDWGATDFQRAANRAAAGGHEGVVRWCRRWGTVKAGGVFVGAAEGGHASLMLLAREWGAVSGTHVERAMFYSVGKGCAPAMQLCKDMGAVEFDNYLTVVPNCKNSDDAVRAAELLKEWGATEAGTLLVHAAWHGRHRLMQLAKDWGALEVRHLNEAMALAADFGLEETVRLLVEWGATDFGAAAESAEQNYHYYLANLLRSWAGAHLPDS